MVAVETAVVEAEVKIEAEVEVMGADVLAETDVGIVALLEGEVDANINVDGDSLETDVMMSWAGLGLGLGLGLEEVERGFVDWILPILRLMKTVPESCEDESKTFSASLRNSPRGNFFYYTFSPAAFACKHTRFSGSMVSVNEHARWLSGPRADCRDVGKIQSYFNICNDLHGTCVACTLIRRHAD